MFLHFQRKDEDQASVWNLQQDNRMKCYTETPSEGLSLAAFIASAH